MSGDPRVRPVTRADLVSVHRIERAVFTQPWSYRAFESSLDAPAFLIAHRPDVEPTVDPTASGPIDGSGIVGYIVGDFAASPQTGHVKNLAVRSDWRGNGLGRQLLETCLGRLETAGVTAVRLEVRASNDPARALYRSTGFTTARRLPNYYGDGETAIVMRKRLTPP